MRSARSGSSLTAKMPRFVRGTRPKCTVSGSPRVRPSATRTGSMSPIRSPTLVSGVASFSPYLSSRCRHATGRSSPASACSRRHRAQTGACGWSLISQPSTAGDHSSRRDTSGAHQPRLALPPLAEQHDVVPGEQRALQGGQHRLVEPDDAREARPARAHQLDEVLADLDLDRPVTVRPEARSSPRVLARRIGLDRTSGRAHPGFVHRGESVPKTPPGAHRGRSLQRPHRTDHGDHE